MDYELARKLKSAGFPQSLEANQQLFVTPAEDRYYAIAPAASEDCRIPALIELLDLCADDFANLMRVHNGVSGTAWIAEATLEGIFQEGSTPSEAVARLWILLNKS